MLKLTYPLQQISEWDHTLSRRFNRVTRNAGIRVGFRIVSRLGDGIFWYSLMAALLLYYRAAAVAPVLHMIFVGLSCTALYKWLKHKTLRPRPFDVNPDVICAAQPLDQFSFPSGHTLHALAFSVVVIAYYPWLSWVVAPFTVLVAASRLVLGLHYPTDVLAGALIGAAVAGLSFAF